MPVPATLPTNVTAGATGHLANSNTVHGLVNLLSTLPTSTKTTAYTLALSDSGEMVEFNSASALTVTVPPNSSAAFPVGTVIGLCQLGVGQLTVAGGSGVTVRTSSSLTTRTQYSEAALRKRATDEWCLAGDTT